MLPSYRYALADARHNLAGGYIPVVQGPGLLVASVDDESVELICSWAWPGPGLPSVRVWPVLLHCFLCNHLLLVKYLKEVCIL